MRFQALYSRLYFRPFIWLPLLYFHYDYLFIVLTFVSYPFQFVLSSYQLSSFDE